MRISEYFEIGKEQPELDFVDIPIHTDLPLFIDPYALGLEDDEWFQDAKGLVIHFFENVLQLIRQGDHSRAKNLLNFLNEPNETHLGFSSQRPAGRGIGRLQAADIHERLSQSEAVRTGFLKDLEDCELVIPGISRDKISDITTNVIRGKLIEYTQTQCVLRSIPTRSIPSGFYWDPQENNWRNRYVDLPVLQNRPLILVPRVIVRFDMAYDCYDYYNNFVLNYFRAEHLDASTSLVHVLKSGARRVYKKDLKGIHPFSKEFLYEFSLAHPDVLDDYKANLPPRIQFLSNDALENVQPEYREFDPEPLIVRLQGMPPGSDNASHYHSLMKGIIEYIFYPDLWKPVKEQEIHEGRKRIDIVCNNVAKDGFFRWLNDFHHIQCPYIMIECKNYSSDPKNPELDQLIGRFSSRRGKFGMLICRSVADQPTLTKRCQDAVHDGHGFIIVLTDEDIIDLMRARETRNDQAIWDILDGKFRQLVL